LDHAGAIEFEGIEVPLFADAIDSGGIELQLLQIAEN
jgi:hypothetical protein